MNPKELSELSDQELLQEAKKMKSAVIMNALFIGFLIGIVLFSLMKNKLGLVTLIPLYFAYRLTKNSTHTKEELENLLRERNLK